MAGRKSVSSLAVPPRSYSCGCNAGWPSGCELRPLLRDGLVRPSFIFVQLHDPRRLRLLVRQLDQSFFSGVWASYVVTVPLLRTRSAEPVRTQVRVR